MLGTIKKIVGERGFGFIESSEHPSDVFFHDGRRYLIMGTADEGCHSGRMRYLVVCGACNEMLHQGTTGPSERIKWHGTDCTKPANPAAEREDY